MHTSAINSPNSTVSEGNCVVCGKETALRCQNCAANGTNWMFFCGKEHQRLLWKKVHAPVCGVRSNPFRWPGLNKSEVEDCRTILKTDKDSTGCTWMSRFAQLVPGSDVEETKFELLLDQLQHKGFENPIPDEKVWLLVTLRACIWKARLERTAKSSSKCVRRIFIDAIGPTVPTLFPLFASKIGLLKLHHPNQATLPPWANELQHRLLIYVYLRALERVEAPEAIEGAGELAAERIRKFARETIAQTHPSAAKDVLNI
ncbi:hypothetical protein JCM3765_007793 [Sporobolomyces pararoseus]